jgi:hypothetical protein
MLAGVPSSIKLTIWDSDYVQGLKLVIQARFKCFPVDSTPTQAEGASGVLEEHWSIRV